MKSSSWKENTLALDVDNIPEMASIIKQERDIPDADIDEGRAAKRQKLDTEELAKEESEDEEIPEEAVEVASGPTDLYLDTVSISCKLAKLLRLILAQINRPLLDFDFEKLCSVTLSNINVYGCLVCGKFFQGRGKKSPAYAHSLNEDHHVYIHSESLKVC